MKEWIEASIVEMEFSETEHGGENLENIDYRWKDDEGYAHSKFTS